MNKSSGSFLLGISVVLGIWYYSYHAHPIIHPHPLSTLSSCLTLPFSVYICVLDPQSSKAVFHRCLGSPKKLLASHSYWIFWLLDLVSCCLQQDFREPGKVVLGKRALSIKHIDLITENSSTLLMLNNSWALMTCRVTTQMHGVSQTVFAQRREKGDHKVCHSYPYRRKK